MSQATPARSAQVIRIARPAPGAEQAVASLAGAQLQLEFPENEAVFSRSGNNLTISLEGGGSVTLTNFFAVGDQTLPTLRLADGTEVAAENFLAAHTPDMDLTTAAGPGAGAGGGGEGEYADDPGALLAGVDKYGKLGTVFWDRTTEVTEIIEGIPADAAGPGAADVPDRASVLGDLANLRAFEWRLDSAADLDDSTYDGSRKDGRETWTRTETLTFETPDGFGGVSIGGTTLINGQAVEIGGKYGTMIATLTPAADGLSGTVAYTYHLGDNVTHEEERDHNTDIADPRGPESFLVVVTDADGDPDSGTINVTVVDDVPSFKCVDDPGTPLVWDGKEYTEEHGSLYLVPGADGATLKIDGKPFTSTSRFADENGSEILSARISVGDDGLLRAYYHPDTGKIEYTYTQSKRLDAEVTHTFTFSAVDGDGDATSAEVEVVVKSGTQRFAAEHLPSDETFLPGADALHGDASGPRLHIGAGGLDGHPPGAGHDIFARQAGTYGGGDTILDFNVEDDKLRFEDLLDAGGDLGNHLSGMSLSDAGMSLAFTVATGAAPQDVEIHFTQAQSALWADYSGAGEAERSAMLVEFIKGLTAD